MTWIWISIAVIVAVLVALIQYDYIFSNNVTNRKPWFAVIRATTVFCIVLLFIGPEFENDSYQTLKPQLVLVADNSRSISNLGMGEELKSIVAELKLDEELTDKFEISVYRFDDQFKVGNSLDFSGKSSDIHGAITQPQELFRDRNKSIVLLTDGNQTVGPDYQYAKIDRKTNVYPIIFGDTARYPDLKISQLNVNRYSYLNNEYPVEVFLNYTRDQTFTTNFRISEGAGTLFQERVTFTPAQKSVVLNFNLTSNTVGLHRMVAQLDPLPDEKNTSNNRRDFAVEVIDQQTKVLLLSNTLHPDMAALKSAIESNRQRSVDIRNLNDNYDINDYNLVVLYGVSSAFAKANSTIKSLEKNTWLILGSKPDIAYLNKTETAFQIDNFPQSDEVQPVVNDAFAIFNLNSFDFKGYPPVQSPFGQISTKLPVDVLMFKQIGDVPTAQPLWFTYEQDDRKYGVFAGAGLWRWRSQSYLDSQNFQNFDDLVNSQIQYLSSSKKRERLDIDAKTFYYENERILLTAQFLNKNYEFMNDGILNIELKNKTNSDVVTRPFTNANNNYTVDLSGVAAGDYTYTVTATGEPLQRSGSFTVLPFDIESQFVSADFQGMQSIAGDSLVYLPRQMEELKGRLLQDPLMQDVERKEITYQSLIDWKILMAFILILLALEWFLRKYTGLI